MTVFLILLLLLIFSNITIAPIGEYHHDYMDKNTTTTINGIFVILVIFSHYVNYTTFPGDVYNETYFLLKSHLKQLVVTTFFFYSGYGMMESIKKRGGQYIKAIPEKYLKLLVKLCIAVILFVVLQAAYGNYYPIKTILISFFGWESVGNSNWYIAVILVEYIFIYIAFMAGRAIKKKYSDNVSIVIITVLTLAFIYFMMRIKLPYWYYDTVIMMPAGFIYSKYRECFERIILKNDLTYAITVMLAVGLYVLTFLKKGSLGIECQMLWTIAFVGLIVLASMKMHIENAMLLWMGKHIFGIYILQRLSMIVLARAGCIESHRYISLIVVIVVTAVITIVFENLTDKINNKLFKRFNKAK